MDTGLGLSRIEVILNFNLFLTQALCSCRQYHCTTDSQQVRVGGVAGVKLAVNQDRWNFKLFFFIFYKMFL